jgi:hypothetical protein
MNTTVRPAATLLPLGALALGWAAASALAETLSYVDLVHRLADLERLALLPPPGERCAQWSSYDRASRYDAATGRYLNWDANGDGDGYIRQEGDQFVFAEMEGPGCIWRIWSAAPKEGRVKIYLDGASEPAVDLPFRDYFDGQHEPFTRSALVHTVALGWNNYTPIPYQKSCKIVAEKGWGAYYQFVYTTFPQGTQVPTFKRRLSAEENAALDAVNARLARPGPSLPPAAGEEVKRQRLSAGGGGVGVVNLTGPRAIKTLRARVDPPFKPEDRAAVREWTIRIQFDGEDQPSVWAPFADFFGTTAGANPYRSLPCGLTEDGLWYSHWFMPFAKTAVITLENEGREARTIDLEVVTVPLREPIERYARFHAKWHRDAFLPEDPVRRAIDWTMLKTEGRGRFLGVMLHVWNPRGAWWGEGDEKFWVDGEKFPSTIGTGSEDYFGYAWCNPTLFQHAFHNQTISMNNKGHICVNRWHIADNIPFQQSFEAAIEKYFPNSRPTLYASTVFWYLAPGGRDPYPPLPLPERVGYWNDADLQTWRAKDALEGERLKVLSKTGGNPHEQDLSMFEGRWSGDAHLWWTDAQPGDRLELALPVEKAGRYKLLAALTKAVDYGIVKLTLDGRELTSLDLFNRGVVSTGELDLGTHDLTAGEHRLGVEILGANDQAVKSYMFGLDYVRLVPAP